MRTRRIDKTARPKLNPIVFVGVLLTLIAVMAVSVFTIRSEASGNESAAPVRQANTVSPLVPNLKAFMPWSNVIGAPLLSPPLVPGIATYEYSGGCTTNPKSSFSLGETVCAVVTGAAQTVDGRPTIRIGWVSPYGSLTQGANITQDPQTGTYAVPATALQTLTDAGGGQVVVDNRGVWSIGLYSTADGSLLQNVYFTVHDPAKAFVDLSLHQSTSLDESEVGAGSGSVFKIFLENKGPDAAQNVVLSDTMPANVTFTSAVEETTLGFVCGTPSGGVFTCTLASMPAGTTAEITFAYDVDTGTPDGTILTNTVSVTSSAAPCAPDSTCEIQPNDNTSSLDTRVPPGAVTQTCTLICHENFSVIANTTQGGNPGAFVDFTATGGIFGNCGAISASPASGSFFGLGTTQVNVTSELGGGSCSFTITVVQATPPTISCPPDVTGADDGSGFHTFTAAQIGTPTTNPTTNVTVTFERSDNVPATYDDNGNVLTPAVVHAIDDPYPLGTTGITWTVTDSNGLKASCLQKVIVTGNCPAGSSAPSFTTFPADITTATGPNSTTCGVVLDDELVQPEVADNATCAVTVSVSGIPPGNLFPIGTTTITYTATNGAGTVSRTQRITVTDNTPPVIFAPANASYTCPEQVPALSPSQAFGPNFETGLPDPTKPVFDNCGPPTVTATQTTSGVGSAASPLVITRTYSALDSHGNTASAVQVITVTDSTPPTITAPADVTAYTGAGATTCDTVVSLGNASASDNCAGVQVSRSPSGNTFPVGVTTVVWTATDWAGNTATANQTVTVIDNTPPLISCPSNIVLEPTCPSGAIGSYVTPVGTDNCPGATTSLTAGLPSGSIFPIGVTTTVTYTVNDAHGNSASCSFTVRVKTAQQTIQDMMAAVSALQPPLTGTQVQGLTSKLQAALDAINQGKTNVACNKLSDFISQISAYINNGTLTSAQGTPLITSANHVRNTIGCTNNPCS
ncbi:MAG TPA: HYR domain-containing protein [Pyrinomonadaceae bacterium]|nr:HYR domain-containing protein [Pyrinomonadaceae bacterium]